MRILITGGGTATALCVLKGLRSQTEIPVHVTIGDGQDAIAGRYLADDFLRIPMAHDPEFVGFLQDYCHRYCIDLLIPVVDYEFGVLANSAGRFLAQGTRVAISHPEVIATCGDKLAFARLMISLGIPVAKIYDRADVIAQRVAFPLFVKPQKGGRASLGAQKVNDLREFEVACRHLDDPLIQEFIDGNEHTVDALCDFNGHFIAAMPRVRLETKAGVSVKGCTIDDPELIQLVKKTVEALPIFGPANLQCFRRRDGSVVVSEVNPRFAGALALSLASGFNSPWLLLKLTRGQKIDPAGIPLRYGVKMFRYWQEVFVHADGRVVTDPWPLTK